MSNSNTVRLPSHLKWQYKLAVHVILSLTLIVGQLHSVSARDNSSGNEKSSQVNLTTLRQVQLIFRHGLRSPEKAYPGDPYSQDSFWPQGWGHLTNLGKKQQFELGQYIQDRYKNFLSTESEGYSYFPEEFQAISSDSDRAIMSVLTNLAGLFPPNLNDQWSDQGQLQGWQPIPIRTLSKQHDRIIRATASCPKYDKIWKTVLASQEVIDFNKNYLELYSYIGNHTGEKYVYPIDLTTFYEALIIQEAHNLSLPVWTRQVYPTQQSSNFLAFAFSLAVHTEDMKRLRGGPLLSQILTNFQNKIKQSQCRPKSKKGLKMIMYSGHDITLVRILSALNVFNPPHLPDFNSLLMVELHKNLSYVQNRNNTQSPSRFGSDYKLDLDLHSVDSVDSDAFYIEIFYRNGITDSVKLDIEGCPEPCTIRKFEQIFKDRLISKSDWNRECFDESQNKEEHQSTFGFWSNFYNALRYWLV